MEILEKYFKAAAQYAGRKPVACAIFRAWGDHALSRYKMGELTDESPRIALMVCNARVAVGWRVTALFVVLSRWVGQTVVFCFRLRIALSSS